MIYGRGEHIFNYDAIIGTTWIGGGVKARRSVDASSMEQASIIHL